MLYDPTQSRIIWAENECATRAHDRAYSRTIWRLNFGWRGRSHSEFYRRCSRDRLGRNPDGHACQRDWGSLPSRRRRPRQMRTGSISTGSISKGIQGVSHQKADTQYNYHCCDGLKHERPPARPFFSNEGSVRTVKGIHRATAVGLAIEDFRQRICCSIATKFWFLIRNRAFRFTAAPTWFQLPSPGPR